MLAVAHSIDRLMESGVLRNHADAAQMLGVTRARMTQIMNLLVLQVELQERVLLGDVRVRERGLRSKSHAGRAATPCRGP
jgi:hypothetical protein